MPGDTLHGNRSVCGFLEVNTISKNFIVERYEDGIGQPIKILRAGIEEPHII